jgi:hypothetical protein
LYQQIREFDTEVGMNNLLNVSKEFQTTKKAKFHWNLNKAYSAKYLSNNMKFVSKFNFLLTDTKTQLSLKLPAFKKDTDISSLSNVYAVDFSGSKRIVGINALRNLHTINLNMCFHIVDVSGLDHVHKLDLGWCY